MLELNNIYNLIQVRVTDQPTDLGNAKRTIQFYNLISNYIAIHLYVDCFIILTPICLCDRQNECTVKF